MKTEPPMDDKEFQITFVDSRREQWIDVIMQEVALFRKRSCFTAFRIVIGERVVKQNIEPFHIVSLCCLIDLYRKRGLKGSIAIADTLLRTDLIHNLKINKYFAPESAPHEEAISKNVLNIWRIIDDEKEMRSHSIQDYFQRKHFRGYDLSALNGCLNELFYNVFDHADAKGNAFFYIHYYEERQMISIAACDFGKGVAVSLRQAIEAYREMDDRAVIQEAIKPGVTARSRKHNSGQGLDNIIALVSQKGEFRIVSNKGIVAYCNGEYNSVTLSSEFPGTLIYFNVPVAVFEKLEEIDESTFDSW